MNILITSFRRNTNTIDSRSLLFDLLWRDTKLATKSPESLPLTRYFGGPYGWMIARTGWGNNGVLAEMKVNVYNFSNHQPCRRRNFSNLFQRAIRY